MSRSLSFFRRWFPRASVRKPARSYSHKPSLELLEGRALPSTIAVTNLLDSGDGSLRAAITEANRLAGDDIIAFAGGLNGNILLASALPDLASNIHIIDIQDPGETGVTVRRDPTADTSGFGIFKITHSNVVAISGLTISDGYRVSGGGIDNDGTLALTNCTLSGNTAGTAGGGIGNSGTLTLTNCTVSGNSASGDGGGINNFGGGLVTLTNSTVSGNSGMFGGGIANGDGLLTLTNSTVSGNSASLSGGGISNSRIWFNAPTATLTNCTISGNSASYVGGGIYNGDATLTLRNTIVANSSSGGDVANFGIITGAHNLIEDGSGLGVDTVTGDPNLGPLADNGGPTWTHALLTGSLAINAGFNVLIPAGVTTDQRGPGFARISGGTVDIGAFEVQLSPPDQQITHLRVLVDVLYARGRLNQGQQTSLMVDLDHAEQQLAQGQIRVAYNLIGAFGNHVQGLIAGPVLSPEEGDALWTSADLLRETLLSCLDCPPDGR